MTSLVVLPTVRDISPEESERLHLAWWGECHTCKNWQAPVILDRHVGFTRPNLGEYPCVSHGSDLSGQAVWSSGHCNWWDSFDIDTAIKIIDLEERQP